MARFIFRMKQVTGETNSTMHVRMKALQKEADINAITRDEAICQVMLTACQDKTVICDLMKEENMSETKLDEIVKK